MVEVKLSRSQLEKILVDHPKLTLQTTFEPQRYDRLARLSLVVGHGVADDPERLDRDASTYGSLFGLVVGATFFVMAFAASTNSVPLWLTALACALGALALFALRRRLQKRTKVIRELDENYGDWEFAHSIQQTWQAAAEDDETVAWLVTQWLLTELEIEYLEERIREGVCARKHLSPIDPLRARMQVEIDTLRNRRDRMRISAEVETKQLDEHARCHSDAKKREKLEEQRNAARAEAEASAAREFDQRVRSVAQTEQERLKKQERAQKWLYDDTER